jgi:hypothetical protein
MLLRKKGVRVNSKNGIDHDREVGFVVDVRVAGGQESFGIL